MKKRILIICSIIGVLLAGFQFPIYAEETTPDYSSSTSIITSAALDQYFYDNYELLPYIESDGSQYIHTGILYNSDSMSIKASVSNLSDVDNTYLFGTFNNNSADRYALGYFNNENYSDKIRFFLNNTSSAFNNFVDRYNISNIYTIDGKLYINDILFDNVDKSFLGTYDLVLFGLNNQGNIRQENLSSYNLYRFSIYDYSANDGEGALVRDYYPARSKSGGIIGLYDAVSKTFVTTSGSVPFASPDGDPVNMSVGANITQFLSGSLSWIDAIFEGINEMPIIWVFIAIALAGVAFRWARRIVHF